MRNGGGREAGVGGTVTLPISGVQDSLPLMESHQAAVSLTYSVTGESDMAV